MMARIKDKTAQEEVINEMVEAVTKVARGDYSVQVEFSGKNDDLDSLAMGLNMMTDDIRTSMEDLNRQRKELNDINIQLQQELIQRKQAEEELKRSRDFLEKLTNSMWDVVFSAKMPERIIEWANNSVNIIGYTPEECIGKTTEFLYHDKEGFLAFGNELKSAIAAGKDVLHTERLLKRKNGEVFPAEITITFFKEEGGVVRTTSIIRDITKRKLVEAEMKVKDKAIASSINAIAISSLRGNLTYINDSFLKIWGYDDEKEVLGKNVTEFWEVPEKVMQVMGAVMDRQGGWIGELTAKRKDGSLFDIQMATTTVTDTGGKPICLMGSFLDITERKMVENTLKERMKELTCLYQVQRILQEKLPVDEVCKQVLEQLVPAMQYPEITAVAIELDGKRYASERYREGLSHSLHTEITAQGNARGHLDVCYTADKPFLVTEELELLEAVAKSVGTWLEQKQATESLLESEGRYRTLFESSADGILVTNAETKSFSYCNSAISKLLGYSEEELTKMSVPDIVPKDKLEHVMAEFMAQIRQEKTLTLDIPCLKKDGTIVYADIHSCDMLIGGKRYNAGIFRDVTERKRAGEEREGLLRGIKKINRKLEESNKELQDFAYIASHDLREPLRKISSFGSLIQDSLKGKLDEDQQENLEFMINGAQRMQDMIDDLLTYSRLTTSAKPPQRVDLNEVIEDLKKLELATLLDETQGTIHVPEPLLPVQADPFQMHQLFQNLLGNGLKFHKEGIPPEITIRARQVENNMIRIEVEDNGIGIAEEYHEQVFVMFKRLHSREQYEGTGIGLAVCKKIVERHRGNIGVKSTPGEGSTFWFSLPRGSYSGDS
jgi:PAS domain S-box-containing protein